MWLPLNLGVSRMNTHTLLHLAHLLILGPFLLYIGVGYPIPLSVVVIIGAFVILYQAFKTYQKYTAGDALWVNLFHVIVVGPALVAYGWSGARFARELILMLGFAAIGYHGYYMLV
jgi:hypothetical protein